MARRIKHKKRRRATGTLALSERREAALVARLQQAGLRKTLPRILLTHILFRRGNRHITAEALYAEAYAAGVRVSQATIYNTLNQFRDAGLLREVVVDHTRNYFDTNLDDHHHFYIEDEERLIDVPYDDVAFAYLPRTPRGFDVADIDVVIRLNRI